MWPPLKFRGNLPIGSAEGAEVKITCDYVRRILSLCSSAAAEPVPAGRESDSERAGTAGLASDLATARAAIDRGPVEMDACLRRLAGRIRAGRYQVPADAVAERMLDLAEGSRCALLTFRPR